MLKIAKTTSHQAGFAFVEALLVLVIIVLVVVAGVYVAKHHRTTNQTATTTADSSQNQTAVTAKPGTATNVTQLVEQSAQSEAAISTQNDNAETQAALSANSAASNLGGAYDESTL